MEWPRFAAMNFAAMNFTAMNFTVLDSSGPERLWVGKTVANVKQVPNRGQKERNGFNFRETRANLQSALELRVVLGLCIHPQDVTPLE